MADPAKEERLQKIFQMLAFVHDEIGALLDNSMEKGQCFVKCIELGQWIDLARRVDIPPDVEFSNVKSQVNPNG